MDQLPGQFQQQLQGFHQDQPLRIHDVRCAGQHSPHWHFPEGWHYGAPDGARLENKDDRTYKARQGAYIAVDILESKAMQENMVVVSASEIGKSLAVQGKVAIYGILFDTGKADVKPASKASLDQIAAFLKADNAVKLHVVGPY